MGGIVTTKFEKTSFTPETGCQSGPCSVTYVTGTDHVQVGGPPQKCDTSLEGMYSFADPSTKCANAALP